MRRFSMFAVMAASLLVMVPASAQTADPIVACPAPPEGTTVIGPDQKLLQVVKSPTLPEITVPGVGLVRAGDSVTYKYQLDLSPATASNVASVGAYLDWTLRSSDWDLLLLNDEGGTVSSSRQRQAPRDIADSYENVFRLSMAHCTVFQVRVYNYSALSGDAIDSIDPLKLEITTSARR